MLWQPQRAQEHVRNYANRGSNFIKKYSLRRGTSSVVTSTDCALSLADIVQEQESFVLGELRHILRCRLSSETNNRIIMHERIEQSFINEPNSWP